VTRQFTIVMPASTASPRRAVKQAARKVAKLRRQADWADVDIDWTPVIQACRNAVIFIFRYDPIYGAIYEDEEWTWASVGDRAYAWTPDDIDWPDGFAPSWQPKVYRNS